jgi:hypothetical protein
MAAIKKKTALSKVAILAMSCRPWFDLKVNTATLSLSFVDGHS